jgi:hypothetical protein
MNRSEWHLAQVNIGRAKGSPADPVMAGFMARWPELNALADRSPGFVRAVGRERMTWDPTCPAT